MKTNILASIISLMLAGTSTVMAQSTPSAEGATVYFVNLEDGATVTSPFKVIFGLSGMGVAPAGTEKENTGHHHLFINPVLDFTVLKLFKELSSLSLFVHIINGAHKNFFLEEKLNHFHLLLLI